MIDEIVDTFVKDDAPKWVRDSVRKEVRKYYINNFVFTRVIKW